MSKSAIISPKMVQLIVEDKEAEASLTLNPDVGWMKFVLTDDLPNGNKQRVPESEFDNLIKTGLNMPIKVAGGTIKEGHDDSYPLGVITNLTKENNTIVGLAAIWKKERPDDYLMLKELYDKKEPIDLSWEITYQDSRLSESGIQDLLGTSLRATTIVGSPAYKGRTRVIAFASTKLSEDYLSKLPDSSFLLVDDKGDRYFPYKDSNGNVDIELVNECLNLLKSDNESFASEIRTKLITDAEKLIKNYNYNMEVTLEELEKLKTTYDELSTKYNDLQTLFGTKEDELNKANTAVAELQKFKDEIEAEKAKVAKFEAIKAKFSEASLNMGDKYFEDKKETLLSLSDEALDFFVQELIAFANTDPENKETKASIKVPKFISNEDSEFKSPADIAKALRNQKQ